MLELSLDLKNSNSIFYPAMLFYFLFSIAWFERVIAV